MRTEKQIRAGLENAAQGRAEAEKLHAEASAGLGQLLQEAQSVKGLTVVEAAALAGLSRQAAYEILERDRTAAR